MGTQETDELSREEVKDWLSSVVVEEIDAARDHDFVPTEVEEYEPAMAAAGAVASSPRPRPGESS
jgi:hypothetical protein